MQNLQNSLKHPEKKRKTRLVTVRAKLGKLEEDFSRRNGLTSRNAGKKLEEGGDVLATSRARLVILFTASTH